MFPVVKQSEKRQKLRSRREKELLHVNGVCCNL